MVPDKAAFPKSVTLQEVFSSFLFVFFMLVFFPCFSLGIPSLPSGTGMVLGRILCVKAVVSRQGELFVSTSLSGCCEMFYTLIPFAFLPGKYFLSSGIVILNM